MEDEIIDRIFNLVDYEMDRGNDAGLKCLFEYAIATIEITPTLFIVGLLTISFRKKRKYRDEYFQASKKHLKITEPDEWEELLRGLE